MIDQERERIANEIEGAGWGDAARALRDGSTLEAVIEQLGLEHYPDIDLIAWLEEQQA